MLHQKFDGILKRHLRRKKYGCTQRDHQANEFHNTYRYYNDSSCKHSKHGVLIFLFSIALTLNIYNPKAFSRSYVVGFGNNCRHYQYANSAVSFTTTPPRGGGSSSSGSYSSTSSFGDSNNPCLSYQNRRRASNLVIMMIYNNKDHHHQNSNDDDTEKTTNRSYIPPPPPAFVPRMLIDVTMLRPKHFLATFTTRLQKSALQMFSKRSHDVGTSSTALPLSGTSTSTSNESTTGPLVAETTSLSIQKRIADHATTITTELEAKNEVDDELSAISSTTIASSVHLRLTDPTLMRQSSESKTVAALSTNEGLNNNDKKDAIPSKPAFGITTVIVHTYTNTATNQTWKALNISKRKFRSYLQYCDVWSPLISKGSMSNHSNDVNHTSASDDYTGIETIRHSILSTSSKAKPLEEINDTSRTKSENRMQQVMHIDHLRNVTSQLRDEWRSLWKLGRLITDRTELLAVYPSDLNAEETISNDVDQDNVNDGTQSATATNEKHQSKLPIKKRGGFADLLMLYTDRLMTILSDEHEDNNNYNKSSSETQSTDIVQWLETSYGRFETNDLKYEIFQTFDESTKLMKLKHFLEWFRSQFPYYYDRCDTCGASIKEDLAAFAASTETSDRDPTTTTSEETENTTSDNVNEIDTATSEKNGDDHDEKNATDGATEMESEHQTFVGYVYPNTTELMGKASRTELYQCHQCASFTRFPRYNAAQYVMAQKRGRCGEYSMLLYRFIRALRHECRWVVDWADHVWVELLLIQPTHPDNSRWIHLDPCEAAVNENYIYQGWGKKQNYILGFYLPSIQNMESSLQQISSNRTLTTSSNISYIEDITHCYTNEQWSDICQRRDESESHIQSSIVKATHALQQKLLEYYNFTQFKNNNNSSSTVQCNTY